MELKEKKAALPKLGGFLAWTIWGVASLFYLYEYVLRVAPSVMVHELMLHFQMSAAGLGTLVALYYYAYSPMQLLVGMFLDRFGGRKVLPLAAGMAGIGCFLFSLGHSHWVAGLGRLLQGAGSAFAFVGAMYVATNWFPERRFALLSGLTTMLGMVGAAGGQAPLAFAVRHIGWEISWLFNAVAGLFLMMLLWLFIPKRPPWAEKKSQTTSTGSQATSVWKGLKEVAARPQTWLIGLYGGMIYVPTSTFAALWGVPFLETSYDLSKIMAATAISMTFVGWALGAPLAGWLSDRFKRRKPLMILGALGVFFICLAIIYFPTLTMPGIFALMILLGMFSGGQVVCFAAAYETNKKSNKGSSLAMTNMLVMITAALFQPLVGWLLDLHVGNSQKIGTAHLTKEDFHFALLLVPLSVFLAVILSMFIKETHARPPTE